MSSKVKSLILPFYFGSIADNDRTLVERELLVDSEVLLDYLDLKRSIEQAEQFPQQPSLNLWRQLNGKIKTRKKLFVSLSVGAAAAIMLLVSVFVLNRSQDKVESKDGTVSQEILFDSMNEPNGGSSVL